MAAKTKRGRKRGTVTSKSKVPAVTVPAAEPIDVMHLHESLDSIIIARTGYQSAFAKAQTLVKELKAKLDAAQIEVERLAAPGRAAAALLTAADLANDPTEAKIRSDISRVELFNRQWSKGPNGEDLFTPNGARPWHELIRDGATDAQIRKNLEHVDNPDKAAYRIEAPNYGAKNISLVYRDKNYKTTKIWANTAKAIAETRRIFGIGMPAPTQVKPAATAMAKLGKKIAALKSTRAKKSAKKAAAPAKSPSKKAGPKAPAKPKSSKKPAAAAKPSANGKHATNGHATKSYNGEGAKCCLCGCTAEKACIGGCTWVEHPTDSTKALCSACLPLAKRQASNFQDPPKNGKKPKVESPPELAGVGNLGPDFREGLATATIASLNKMEAALLRAIVGRFPYVVTKKEAAELAGYQEGGKVSTAIRNLVDAKLLEQPQRGKIKAVQPWEIDQPAAAGAVA